jgi:hypothetical protein
VYCHGRGREFESRRPRHSFQALAESLAFRISPHLGDRIPTNWTIASGEPSIQRPKVNNTNAQANASIVALPLGGRIKVEPYNDQLHLLNFKSPGPVAEYEKMPFEVTPFVLYLTRQNEGAPKQPSAE